MFRGYNRATPGFRPGLPSPSSQVKLVDGAVEAAILNSVGDLCRLDHRATQLPLDGKVVGEGGLERSQLLGPSAVPARLTRLR